LESPISRVRLSDAVAKKYPLEPLVTLLREREKARAGTVRDALQRAEAERAELDRARGQRERFEAETRAERERERAAFDDRGVRVRDLQQSELFRIGAERALGALAVSESEHAARSARSELARVNRDKQVVERHRARFDAEEERRSELAREEAAADLALSRRRGARSE
jgi:hypothetical protein